MTQFITAIVKEIDTKTGRTRIISVTDLMNDHPGHEENIRITLEHFGTLKMGVVIYHPVKGMPYIDLLGKSVQFELRDGEVIQMKIQGIMFGDKLSGIDTEGFPILVGFDEIDHYYLNGTGGKYFEIL